MLQLIEFAFMLVIDLSFIVVVLLLMMPLGLWRQAAYAVMKRNFVGYFNNPTGYVFLCLFVLLTSFAAFWPHEFFTTNLANFDQLNKFLPYIMLIFIPAITMSIWAEERRQGTDELLLTLPARDFDIVIGKYFAAVLVFTVSLLFSQLSNYAVLIQMTGGQLDSLLLFSTYLGYWFIGVAMLSLGMVASFLTNNLTVGFIFGVAFNAPLAFISNSDVIFSNSKWVSRLFDWSLLQRFEPFGRGLISLPSVFYFMGIVVVGIYLSLILIGRRHWLGGRDGVNLLWHYIARAGFMVATVIGIVLVAQYSPLNQARVDISAEKVSTLSDSTQTVLSTLLEESNDDSKPPVKIEAYVSNNIPTEFVQTKYDLVNLLREFDVLGGNRVQVTLHQSIEPFSEEAIEAEKKYGIRPRTVQSQSRGAVREQEVIMGVAISSGLERVVIPFFPYGMPVEYELMRSINTVSRDTRKTLGIIRSDAFVAGTVIPNAQGQPVQVPPLKIMDELAKQYNVELVDAQSPIELWEEDDNGKPTNRRYDVLMAVQPSKLLPVELENLIAAIHSGQPTAIFEDPLPAQSGFSHFLGTFLPRRVNRGGTEMCDIQELWQSLDIDIDFASPSGNPVSYLTWDNLANNYPRDNQLETPELVVVRRDLERPDATNPDHPITRGIKEVYFQFCTYLSPLPNSELKFVPLVEAQSAGKILYSDFARPLDRLQFDDLEGQRDALRGNVSENKTIAAQIIGAQHSITPPASLDAISKNKNNVNVVYVADVDVLSDYFMEIRDYPIRNGIRYQFQNLNLVLNSIDFLANEEAYFDIRDREVRHVSLAVVEKTTENAMDIVYDATQALEKEYSAARGAAENQMEQATKPLLDKIQKLTRKRDANQKYDAAELREKYAMVTQVRNEQQRRFSKKVEELQNERREKLRRIQLDAELEIQKIQRKFKLAAVLLPPITPLLVGLIVYTRRRLREREGIAKARRLK